MTTTLYFHLQHHTVFNSLRKWAYSNKDEAAYDLANTTNTSSHIRPGRISRWSSATPCTYIFDKWTIKFSYFQTKKKSCGTQQ